MPAAGTLGGGEWAPAGLLAWDGEDEDVPFLSQATQSLSVGI